MAKLKSMSRPDHNRSLHRRRMLLAGLALFLLVDVGLVASALTANKAPANAGAPVVEPVVTTPVETTPPPVEPAVVEPVETKPVETKPPTRILTALDSQTAWRANVGSCPTTTAIAELTTDGGATWSTTDASIDTGASSILAINVDSDSEASFVTQDVADCAPQLVTTFVAGDQWKAYPDRLDGYWYIEPADHSAVHSPIGSFRTPCGTVTALAARSDTSAGAICSDGRFVRTTDSGATWGRAVAVPGAANLNVTSDGYILAAANQPGCAGAQILATPEALDSAPEVRGCREVTFNPTDIALASADDLVLLWAGNTFAQSSDGGATWG